MIAPSIGLESVCGSRARVRVADIQFDRRHQHHDSGSDGNELELHYDHGKLFDLLDDLHAIGRLSECHCWYVSLPSEA